jgi:phosphohistidine phosphatase
MIDSGSSRSQADASIANRLWIIRHADAQGSSSAATDFERPLSTRGVVDCARLCTALTALGARADRIVASDARRTRATAELLAPAFHCSPAQLFFDHRAYAAPAEALLQLLQRIPEETTAAVLVGHNPGVSELAAHLLINGWRHGLPPLGAVCAAIDTPWESLDSRVARLEHYLEPENLG